MFLVASVSTVFRLLSLTMEITIRSRKQSGLTMIGVGAAGQVYQVNMMSFSRQAGYLNPQALVLPSSICDIIPRSLFSTTTL